MSTSQKKVSSKSIFAKVYQAVWRWHFWAGLVAAPFLILISVTGSIYVFKQELEPLIYPELYLVEPSEKVASLEEMRQDLQTALPDYTPFFISLPDRSDRSWFGAMQKRDENGKREFRWIFYDPFQKKILGHRANDEGFFEIVLKIHRTFFAGEIGRILSETATCWGIISILSGLYLWWPRKKGKVLGVWLPRVKGRFRTMLRDWHTVPGVYISFFVLLIMISGLLFTKIWGQTFLLTNALTGGLPKSYLEQPQSTLAEDMGEPIKSISLDDAFAAAQTAFDFGHGYYSIEIPHEGSTEAIKFTTNLTKPLLEAGIVFVDQYSAEVLMVETSSDFPLMTQISLFAYPVHVGSIFGLTTKILAFISCLLIIAMSITGVWMWWRRRPSGKTGAPLKQPAKTVPRWIAWVTIGLAIFLPTVGFTLLAIGLISWIWQKVRKPSLRVQI